jgi:hypothetical protein
MNTVNIGHLEDASKIKNWLMAMLNASEYEWGIANNDHKFRNKLIENSWVLVDHASNHASPIAIKTIRDILDLIATYSQKIRYVNRRAQPVLNDIALILETAL